jgi:Xaa-Pro aminopeptidase
MRSDKHSHFTSLGNVMKKFLIIFFLSLTSLLAQPPQLDMKVFAERRKIFMEKIDSLGTAIFPCKPEYSRNGDVNYEYRQESNFYYLSGFEEPEALLVMNPSFLKNKFVMFVRKRDLRREVWNGPRAGIEGAMTMFGADTAVYYDDFDKLMLRFRSRGPLYYRFGVNPEIDTKIEKAFSGGTSPIIDPSYILSEMRVIKNDGDWKMGMKQCIDISALAQREAIKSVKPEMFEYELQGMFEYIYRKSGSPRNGYPCIVGSGPNSTILHYDKNDRQMHDGEVVLMDCAAEYGYYSADITRTVPVNGKFSPAQKDIYRIVLNAQNAAMKLVKPGVEIKRLETAIDSVLGNGLRTLGLIKNEKDFRLFSIHGYSHWIGLEVHDVGAYSLSGKSRRLEPGMVFTIEPGIYVRPTIYADLKEKGYTDDEITRIKPIADHYMNIGVRIEDDIEVTERGYINLSESVPREMN